MLRSGKEICVGIDIRDLKVARTGQKTVIEGIYNQFRSENYPGVRFVFFKSSLPVYTGKKKWMIMLEHIRLQWWKQIEIPIRAVLNRCDIVFCGDYFVPYVHLGYKTVAIFHDAFFFETPQFYNPLWISLFRSIAIPSARRCARIMTVSEYAKERLHLLAGFPSKQLTVVHTAPKSLSVSSGNSAAPVSELEDKKYFLHVGVMEKRKNLPLLIGAFAMFQQMHAGSDFYLVLVGQGSGKINSEDYYNILTAIKRHGIQDRVILTGYLKDAQLAFAYQRAFAYVFPSTNEGFGLPILEAFRFGLPVIASGTTSLPEIGGDGVLYFDPGDPADIAAKMQAVALDSQLRSQLVEKGKLRLNDFSWKKTGAELVQLFRDAL